MAAMQHEAWFCESCDAYVAPGAILGWDDVVSTIVRSAIAILVGFAPAVAAPLVANDLGHGERNLLVLGGTIGI